MNSCDDSVPELADAIQKLINSRPYSPSKPELEKVIRDHVDQQLKIAMGEMGSSSVWPLPPVEMHTEGEHVHDWAHLSTHLNNYMDCHVVTELCTCGQTRTREVSRYR